MGKIFKKDIFCSTNIIKVDFTENVQLFVTIRDSFPNLYKTNLIKILNQPCELYLYEKYDFLLQICFSLFVSY